MKILFLSHYFPPEVNAPASRTYDHCREWAQKGEDVTVVTCFPNHPGGQVYQGFKNRLYEKGEKSGVNLLRVWTYITANEGFLKRTLGYVSFMLSSIVASLFVGKQDVVVTTSPQFFNGLAGYFVSRLKRIPWVLEIRDLWPESIVAVGAITNPRVIRILEGIELFCYRKASKIVVVTDSFKAFIEAKGIDPEKIHVIKNGVDLDLFGKPVEGDDLARQLGVQGKFVAAYVGTHGMAHHLETIFEAADLLSHRDDIRFLMIGSGARKATLQQMRDEKGLNNVVMVDQLPKSDMPKVWGLTDASLVLLKRSDLFKTVIPSKIFESMCTRTPIILGVEGEVQLLIEKTGCGICIEPENSQQLSDAVVELADSPGRCQELGDAGRHVVEQDFNRKGLAERFRCLLKDLVVV